MSWDDIDYGELIRQTVDTDTATVRQHKTYAANDWYITVRLTDFFDSQIMTVENEETGEEEKGVFIPFRKNGIHLTGKNNALTTFRAQMAQIPSNRYTHLLYPILDDDTYAERKRLGYEITNMGHMRPKNHKGKRK